MRLQEGVKEAGLPSTHLEFQLCAPSSLEQGRRKERLDVKWAGPQNPSPLSPSPSFGPFPRSLGY